MEELCRVINKCGKVNGTIQHVALEVVGETDIGLVEMCVNMLKTIDKTKVSRLVLFLENFGHNNKKIICFNYDGVRCEIKEHIEYEFDELILEMSPC